MPDRKTASQRVEDAADQLGLRISVKQLTQSSRTADEAALACNCSVAQIVKSLVYRGKQSQTAILLLISGKNRVNEKMAEAYAGEAIERPDAKYVRDTTGFAIGGIPPFAHSTSMRTFIDQDLLAYDVVWAAAGTPNSVFSVHPQQLAEAVSAQTINVA